VSVAVVAPLRGLRYDPARVGDPGAVLAPPYDVISPAERDALYARSPYNVVRLILPRDADRAAAAAATLRTWIEARVLVPDPAPAMYLYSQTFALPDGTRRRRDGVLCRLRLEDFAGGVVRPHERTLPGPKADRLALLRATGANLSPIFGLFARRGERVRDLVGAAAAAPAVADVPDLAGARHELRPVTDPAAHGRVAAALAEEAIVIADGHHRYETALAYRDERGAEPSRWVLACLANMEEDGVVILPTHRLVPPPLRLAPAALEAALREDFTVASRPADRPRRDGEIDCVMPDRRLRLAPEAGARARLAALPPAVRALDVALLHRAVLEPRLGVDAEGLAFTHDDAEAVAAVARGTAAAAFLVNPPSIAQVRAVCGAGELMPEKSTYFFPKLATGLVFQLVGPPWV
jgi:uncharacterized protein (DUF1015 family)